MKYSNIKTFKQATEKGLLRKSESGKPSGVYPKKNAVPVLILKGNEFYKESQCMSFADYALASLKSRKDKIKSMDRSSLQKLYFYDNQIRGGNQVSWDLFCKWLELATGVNYDKLKEKEWAQRQADERKAKPVNEIVNFSSTLKESALAFLSRINDQLAEKPKDRASHITIIYRSIMPFIRDISYQPPGFYAEKYGHEVLPLSINEIFYKKARTRMNAIIKRLEKIDEK